MKRLTTVLAFVSLIGAACSGGSESSTTAASTVESSVVATTSTLTAPTTTVAPTTTTTVVATTTTIDPDLALRAELTAAIDEWMTNRDLAVPGLSLAVRFDDGHTIAIARGKSDVAKDTDLTTEDYFRIGSISKTITAATVLQMVEDGLLGLDDPVSDYLGEWLPGYIIDGVDYGSRVTVRQILGHTDGFKEFAWDLGFYEMTSHRLDQAFDPHEIVTWGLEQGPQFVPGEGYNYNTVGPIAAGLLIEAIAGRPAHEEIRERLFAPLGLEHIFLPPMEAPPTPIVHGYAVGGLGEILGGLPAIASLKEAATIGDYYDILAVPQAALDSVGWTGGGIESQAADLSVLFSGLFDGTLLADASIEAMTTPNDFEPYGLSLDIAERDGKPFFNKGGGVPGFRSTVGYLPDAGVSVAILANSISIDPDVGVLMDAVLTLVAPG